MYPDNCKTTYDAAIFEVLIKIIITMKRAVSNLKFSDQSLIASSMRHLKINKNYRIKRAVSIFLFSLFASLSWSQDLNQISKDRRGSAMLLGKTTKVGLEQKPFMDWFSENYNDYQENEAIIKSIKITSIIKSGDALISEEVFKPKDKSNGNETVTLKLRHKEKTNWIPQKISLDVIYEDSDIIIINKPSGLVVHPGAGNKTGTLVQAIIHHSKGKLSDVGNSERPGIVHRIDKNTSGLIVVAKDNSTHAHLSKQFSEHTIAREYLALVWGKVTPGVGKIESLISRSNRNRKKMMSSIVKGKKAITHYKTIDSLFDLKGNNVASLISCKLETGRTHQIRVHLSENGNPIIGDRVYGRTPSSKIKYLHKDIIKIINSLDGQCLHAKSLGFIHPKTEKIHNYQCDMPKNLRKLIDYFKKKGIENYAS